MTIAIPTLCPAAANDNLPRPSAADIIAAFAANRVRTRSIEAAAFRTAEGVAWAVAHAAARRTGDDPRHLYDARGAARLGVLLTRLAESASKKESLHA